MIGESMRGTQSIILAVISATYEYNNQGVLSFAHTWDPDRIRTLGIITKTDCVREGTEYQAKLLDLERSKTTCLQLGWHGVKNQGNAEKSFSSEQRDADGSDFFNRGIWADTAKDVVGIGPLRLRLGSILFDLI